MLEYYLRTVETIEFQVQFVVVSGFRLLLSIISEHLIVKGLLQELAHDREKAQLIYERIIQLLPKVSTDKESSYDGSIVVYLYCLSERDLSLAYRASLEILDTKGLFWSRRMARAVRMYYLARQITDNIEFTSEKGEPVQYTLTGHEYSSHHDFGQIFYFPGEPEISALITQRYKHQQNSSCRVEIQHVSVSSSGRLDYQDISTPTLVPEFSIANRKVI